MEPTNPVPPGVASTVPQAESTTAPTAPPPATVGPFDAGAPRGVGAVPADEPARPLYDTPIGVDVERDERDRFRDLSDDEAARLDRLIGRGERPERDVPAALMVAEDHWRDNWHNDPEHRDSFARADAGDQMLFLYDVLRRIWQAIGPQ